MVPVRWPTLDARRSAFGSTTSASGAAVETAAIGRNVEQVGSGVMPDPRYVNLMVALTLLVLAGFYVSAAWGRLGNSNGSWWGRGLRHE
jgi:hypothetical protein